MQRIHVYRPAIQQALPNWVFALSWHPNSHQIASAHMDFAVRLWDLRLTDNTDAAQVLSHQKFAVCVRWHPSGEMIASSDAQVNSIYLWDARTGELLDTLLEHIGWPYGLAWSPNGEQLASAGADGRVLLWDTHSRQLLRTLWQFRHQEERGIGFHTLEWSPDGALLVAISTEGNLYCWQTLTWTLRVFRLPQVGREDTLLAFSPDGGKAALLGNGGDVLLVDMKRTPPRLLGKLTLAQPEASNERFRALAWSPSGARIAASRNSNQIILFDRGHALPPLHADLAEITALAFSPDGTMLAAGDNDGALHIWRHTS